MSVVAPKSTTRPEEVPTLHRSSLGKGDSDYGDEKESPNAKPALDHDQEVFSVDSHPNVNGEPIITTGEDVSNFLVDVHDIGGNALTLRSLILGSLLSAFGAAVTQVGASKRPMPQLTYFLTAQIYSFKPASVGVSSIFLLLVIYSFGRLWERLPTKASFEKHPAIARVADFLNPGPFGMKEVCCSRAVLRESRPLTLRQTQ